MRQFRILLAVATAAVAGCVAQEGAPGVNQPGLPPTAVPDVVVAQTDSTNNSINALANDIDLSGTGLTITAVTVDQTLPPLAGATATTDGITVTFTPPATFVGVVTLLYDIEDGDGGTSSGAIAVSVLPIAPPPVAIPDTEVVDQDSGVNDIDVLANDVNLGPGTLSLSNVTVMSSLPASGSTAVMNGNLVRFTPAAGFVGVVVVGYTATDANNSTANGVLTVVVSPLALPVGDPIPVPDAEIVDQDSTNNDIDVLANDVNTSGMGVLTLSGVTVTTSVPSAPPGSHTALDVGDQVRFTPAAGFVGVVVVGYTATDGNGNSADGVLTVVVSPLALPAVGPIPVPDAETVDQDSTSNDIDVLANDVNTLGMGVLTLSGVTVTTSVPSVPPGSHTALDVGDQIRFTPAAGFAGTVVIAYTATDASNNSAPGVLTVVVSPLALPVGVVAIPDAAVVAQDSVDNDIDVLFNDVDFLGDGLTLSSVSIFSSLPPEGTGHAVSINADQVRFTPEAGFAGVVQVAYTATDGNGLTSNGLLTITVTPTPLVPGPLAVPDVGTASSSAIAPPTVIDVTNNDVDPAGGGLTLTAVSITVPAAGAGSVAIVGAGINTEVEYTPTPLFTGVVVISYTARDSNLNTTVGTLTLTVAPI